MATADCSAHNHAPGTLHPVIKDPRLCVLVEGLRPLMHAASHNSPFDPGASSPVVARSLRNAQGRALSVVLPVDRPRV